jgi:hypothetical protein
MKKTILCLFILVSTRSIAQQTLEKGIQTLVLKGATSKNATIEITGTGSIQNNRALSRSQTVLEEIDLYFDVTVSSVDKNGTFKFGVGRQESLAGTYIEISGDSSKSKMVVNRLDNTSLIAVKEYALPFIINPGETYKIRLGKRIRTLIVELSKDQNHFITDTLKYPSPFFGAEWGIPFIACANGTISVSDYELSTPFKLSPRLAVWGDSFIEGSSLDDDKQRYISFLKDSIGYDNIAIMGKGGENSTSLNNRFPSETKWFAGCKYALLAIGVNDLNVDTWKTNITNDILLLKQKGITPIIATLTPRNDRLDYIAQVNKWIRASYNGAYVDLSKVVSANDIDWIAGSCLKDQIHPTAESHKNFFYRIALEAPYLFRDLKAFTIDYANETTSEKVINSLQYSSASNFSTAETGPDAAISVIPGTDLYFRSTAPDKIKFIYDILLVPSRPSTPLNLQPFTNGIFDWINTPGFDAVGDYEYSLDKGITWTTCIEKPIKNSRVDFVDVRVKAGLKNFRSLPLHIDHLTGIASQELNRISVYPNPVKNMLTIAKVTGEAVASVYANDGRLVNTFLLTAESNNISLQTLPNGIYMLVIVADKESRTLKLLKED